MKKWLSAILFLLCFNCAQAGTTIPVFGDIKHDMAEAIAA